MCCKMHVHPRLFADVLAGGLQGRVAWNKGKKMSLETRQKMSLAKQGRHVPRSVRRQMSKSHQGLTHTPVSLSTTHEVFLSCTERCRSFNMHAHVHLQNAAGAPLLRATLTLLTVGVQHSAGDCQAAVRAAVGRAQVRGAQGRHQRVSAPPPHGDGHPARRRERAQRRGSVHFLPRPTHRQV